MALTGKLALNTEVILLQVDATPKDAEDASVASDAGAGLGRQWRWMPWLVIAAAVASVWWLQAHTNPGVTTLVVAILIGLPGITLISIFDIRPESTAGRITLAAGLGILFNCVVGLLIAYFLPLYGISRPLAVLPTSLTILTVTVLGVAFSQIRGRDPMAYFFEGQAAAGMLRNVPFIALPGMAVLGAARLNNHQSPVLAETVLVLALVTIAAGTLYAYVRRDHRPPLAVVYMSTLSILLSSSLRGDRAFGWDIQQEYGVMTHTMSQQIWHVPTNHDAYASMLSLTVFPSILHSVAGLSALMFCRVLVPVVLALLPIGVIAIMSVRVRFLDGDRPPVASWITMVGASFFVIGASVFPQEMPAIGRQSIAMILLAGSLLAWFDASINESKARVVALSLIVGLSFAHYATAYFMAVLLLLSWLSIVVIRFIRRRLKTGTGAEPASFGHVITWVAVAISACSATLWNLVITHNDALALPKSVIAKNGIGLVSVVAQGTASVKEYSKLILQDATKIKWLQVPPGARDYSLVSDSAPSVKGVSPSFEKLSNVLTFGSHEFILLLEVISVGFLLWAALRNRSRINLDIVGIAIAVTVIAGIARFSGSLGTVFSPTRVILIAGISLALPVGLLIQTVAKKYRMLSYISLSALAVVVMADSVGLRALLAGGTLPASLTTTGENVERFAVTAEDFGTAQWLRQLPPASLVQSDRYGLLPLLSAPGVHGMIPVLVPGITDKHAFVFASTVNVLTGRARGKARYQTGITVFRVPSDWFYENYSVVYSTGITRVYH